MSQKVSIEDAVLAMMSPAINFAPTVVVGGTVVAGDDSPEQPANTTASITNPATKNQNFASFRIYYPVIVFT